MSKRGLAEVVVTGGSEEEGQGEKWGCVGSKGVGGEGGKDLEREVDDGRDVETDKEEQDAEGGAAGMGITNEVRAVS